MIISSTKTTFLDRSLSQSIPASGSFCCLKQRSSIDHDNSLEIIGSFLVLTDPGRPRRRYPKTTASEFDDDISHRLNLRLINRKFADWTVAWIFQRLSLREIVSNVRSIPFQNIRRLLEIGAGKHCRLLDFTASRSLTDAVALVGIEHSLLIRDLHLTQCPMLSDAIFRLAVAKLRRLESLKVGLCAKLSGRGLLACLTATRFPASILKVLHLPEMKFVDDMLMDNICKSCRNLEHLNVRGVGLKDDFLASVRRWNPNMRRLEAGENNFTDEGIIRMVDTDLRIMQTPCLQLVELDISGSGVGEKGVLAICSAYSATLEILRLASLRERLTIRCLHTVSQSLPHLKLLDLRFCTLVRPRDLRSLVFVQASPPEIMR
jgi:hypothetical protein